MAISPCRTFSILPRKLYCYYPLTQISFPRDANLIFILYYLSKWLIKSLKFPIDFFFGGERQLPFLFDLWVLFSTAVQYTLHQYIFTFSALHCYKIDLTLKAFCSCSFLFNIHRHVLSWIPLRSHTFDKLLSFASVSFSFRRSSNK